jgi:DNA-binding NarL/FixJ family response regulator
MEPIVRVAILEDHQSIIDGLIFRLNPSKEIEVVASAPYGEDLLPMLRKFPTDVLLLDLSVPTSSENLNQFPMLLTIHELQKEFPALKIIIISTFKERGLVKAAIDRKVHGYIFKDDRASIQQLDHIVMIVAGGGNYFSSGVSIGLVEDESLQLLTPRQMDVLTLACAYPDDSTDELAKRLNIKGSTLRNLLSSIYVRLGVRTRGAAIEKVRQMGLIPSMTDRPFVPDNQQ